MKMFSKFAILAVALTLMGGVAAQAGPNGGGSTHEGMVQTTGN
jgi:hypothetical protein